MKVRSIGIPHLFVKKNSCSYCLIKSKDEATEFAKDKAYSIAEAMSIIQGIKFSVIK